MEYAIVLCFSEKEEQYINNLIKYISDETRNEYMIINNIPPHLSLALFNTGIDKKGIIKSLDQNINMYSGETIKISSIGIFNPAVIYLSPVMNKKIIEINIKTNNILEKINIKNNKYLFNEWVPHISLAVKLDYGQLIKAFETTARHFKAFDCKINRMSLVECNPYREIKIWELK